MFLKECGFVLMEPLKMHKIPFFAHVEGQPWNLFCMAVNSGDFFVPFPICSGQLETQKQQNNAEKSKNMSSGTAAYNGIC